MDLKNDNVNFSMQVEKFAKDKKMSYIDAIVHHCMTTGLEMELAAKMLTSSLKSKIKMEAEGLHFIPKSNTRRLPV